MSRALLVPKRVFETSIYDTLDEYSFIYSNVWQITAAQIFQATLKKPPLRNLVLHQKKKSIIFVIAGIFILLLIFIVFTLSEKNSFNTVHPSPSPTEKDTQTLERVGAENIYNQELNAEYSQYPLPRTPNNTKKFLLKIAKDSIILQGGSADGLIKLDNSIFNSKNVDYLKRMRMVTQVKNALDARENKISGSVIAIFFYNNGPGKIGYEKGKALAYAKISQLHEAVISKKMTIQQAGIAIKDDVSLAQVDKEYKANAYYAFSVTPQQPITFARDFDALIKKLHPDETTILFTGKDKDLSTHKLIDSVYMFAQVHAVQTNETTYTFDQWYAQKEKLYETTIY